MKGIFFSSYLIKFPVDAKEDKQLKGTSEIKKGKLLFVLKEERHIVSPVTSTDKLHCKFQMLKNINKALKSQNKTLSLIIFIQLIYTNKKACLIKTFV